MVIDQSDHSDKDHFVLPNVQIIIIYKPNISSRSNRRREVHDPLRRPREEREAAHGPVLRVLETARQQRVAKGWHLGDTAGG